MEFNKKNYLRWFVSKNERIRNCAFMCALQENLEGNGAFDSCYKLLTGNLSLIEKNVVGLLQKKPQLLPVLVQKIRESIDTNSDACGELMPELAGFVTFYAPEGTDVSEARKLVDDYHPAERHSDKLVRTLLVCRYRDNSWKDKILALLKAKPFNSDKLLIDYIENYNVLDDDEQDLFSAVIKRADGTVSPDIIRALLLRYKTSASKAQRIMELIADNPQNLPTQMLMINALLKGNEISKDVRNVVIIRTIKIIAGYKPTLSGYIRSHFIAVLKSWIIDKPIESLEYLEMYESRYKLDGAQIFVLYDNIIVGSLTKTKMKETQCLNWFKNGGYDTCTACEKFWIECAFQERYFKAFLRHVSVQEMYYIYLLLLNGAASGNQKLRETAGTVFKYFKRVPGISGPVFEDLEQLERIIAACPELKDEVNYFINLNFNCPPQKTPTDAGLAQLDGLCEKYGLRAVDFMRRYKGRLKNLREKRKDEQAVLDSLEQKLK